MDTKDVYWNEGYGWFHIGSRQAPFSAILQGNGYVIKNLYIHLPYESKISLFSVTNNATITQLGLVGHLGSITGSTSVGSLGLAFNTGVIKTFAEAQGRQAGLLGKGAPAPLMLFIAIGLKTYLDKCTVPVPRKAQAMSVLILRYYAVRFTQIRTVVIASVFLVMVKQKG
jgi:hypothetical protein